MKLILKGILLALFLTGCSNLSYNYEKDYSVIETQIQEGDIIIKDNKIFYKNAFDYIMNGKEEVKLLEEYANKNGLTVAPIK